ncbi:MAG: protoporphyrinogen oxidase, partial [Deltaproteobacteria bacterium]|nr:protoporphyrinogen oxidase [Deltaproteobacteria bacterium]
DSSRFLRELAPDLAEKLAGLDYAPLAVLHLAVTKPCPVPERAFGVLFPSESRSSLLGVMFNSELFPHLAPEGRHLLTVCIGGAGNEQMVAKERAELEETARRELAEKLSLSDSTVLAFRKWPRAIPQYHLGHHIVTAMMDDLERRLPGLRFVGADRGGVGVPDRVKAAYLEEDCR